MTDQELRAHQLRALEAYKQLDKILTENKIKYFAIAGTTLGAIRHKGFIPWDDDIDIVMTMDQFNRFRKIAPKVIKAPYRWRHTSVDKSYATLSGGIYYGEDEPLITVFPLVKVSDNQFQRKMQWVVRKVMSPVWQRKVGYHVPQEKMNGKQRLSIVGSTVLAAILPKKTVLNILRRNELKYENRDVEWYCNIYSRYSQKKESIRSDWVKNIVRVPYEDTTIPVVKDYDAYLTHLYGDYMTPPPEKERHPVHTDL